MKPRALVFFAKDLLFRHLHDRRGIKLRCPVVDCYIFGFEDHNPRVPVSQQEILKCYFLKRVMIYIGFHKKITVVIFALRSERGAHAEVGEVS